MGQSLFAALCNNVGVAERKSTSISDKEVRMNILSTLFCLLLVSVSTQIFAQGTKPATLADLAKYRGADRERGEDGERQPECAEARAPRRGP